MEYSYDFPLRLVRAVTRRKGERLQKMPTVAPLYGPTVHRERQDDWRAGRRSSNDPVIAAAVRAAGFTQALKIEPIRAVTRAYPFNKLPLLPAGASRGSEFTGNLGNEEYRFWIGDPYTMSLRGTCRACGAVVFGVVERELHKAKADCCTVLTEVYSKLLKDNNCVVCDTRCWSNKWGVPMCRKCEPAWKFNVRAYLAIHHEAELIRERNVAWQEKNKPQRDVLPPY